ncbi:putative Rhodopsin-like GPCR transmembrane domain [Paratrimastix pyriformis]|uniref:Rhodopsin-like GPCR transmembrane domain n=1 Tax=Paratrimastix pyriformis TaxID=342808 RepID=A0ABQ8UXF2_9EUKA|nr:putative Rhodopsin-like GPCR transmembrane domain [Paratrimastix pyriformis]
MATPFLFLCLFFASLTEARYISGHITDERGWKYLGRFAFGENGGTITVSISSAQPNQKIVIYADDSFEWPSKIYGNDELSCADRLNTTMAYHTWTASITKHEVSVSTHTNRFWYVAAASCETGKLDMEYLVELQNAKTGLWDTALSLEEQGMEVITLIHMVLVAVILGCHGVSLWQGIHSGVTHPAFRILLTALVLMATGSFFNFLHYAIKSFLGDSLPLSFAIGSIAQAAGQLTLVLLMWLIGQGWSISSNIVANRLKLAAIFCTLVGLYGAVQLWDLLEDSVLFLYDFQAGPGVLLHLLRCAAMGWFVWVLRLTVKGETYAAKQTLYIAIGVVFSCWFGFSPLAALAAAFCSVFYRMRIFYSLSALSDVIVTGLLVWSMLPSRANKVFRVNIPPPQGALPHPSSV